MIKKSADRQRMSQRIGRVMRSKKLDQRTGKSQDTAVHIEAGLLSMGGKPLRVKATEVIAALDEVENATTVSDVISSANKAKSLLKKYRESKKMCS